MTTIKSKDKKRNMNSNKLIPDSFLYNLNLYINMTDDSLVTGSLVKDQINYIYISKKQFSKHNSHIYFILSCKKIAVTIIQSIWPSLNAHFSGLKEFITRRG